MGGGGRQLGRGRLGQLHEVRSCVEEDDGRRKITFQPLDADLTNMIKCDRCETFSQAPEK